MAWYDWWRALVNIPLGMALLALLAVWGHRHWYDWTARGKELTLVQGGWVLFGAYGAMEQLAIGSHVRVVMVTAVLLLNLHLMLAGNTPFWKPGRDPEQAPNKREDS